MTQDDDARRAPRKGSLGPQEHDTPGPQEHETVRPPAAPPATHPEVAETSAVAPPKDLFVEDTPTKLMRHQDIIAALTHSSQQAPRAAPAPRQPTPPTSQPPKPFTKSAPPKPPSGPPRPQPRSSKATLGTRTPARSSIPPRAPLSLKPAIASAEETMNGPAADQLLKTGMSADFVRRAQTLEAQASMTGDAAQRTRLLIVASELRAMLGQTLQARVLAEQASKLGSRSAHRQARQLAQLQGDTKAASSHLSDEIRLAPTPTLRAHLAMTQADLERLKHDDALAAGRSLEHAQRNAPEDPRPSLMKLARQLGSGSRPPTFQWPDEGGFAPLSRATAAIVALRGDVRVRLSEASPPVAIFLEAQRALKRRDRQAAANALLLLRGQSGFERAIPWLSAALLAPLPETRPQSLQLLQDLRRELSTEPVRRTLAARALELGDADTAMLALGDDAAPDDERVAFSPAESLTLRALCNVSPDERLFDAVKQQVGDDLLPLLHALAVHWHLPQCAPALAGTSPSTLRAVLALSGEDSIRSFPPRMHEESNADRAPHPLLVWLQLEEASARRDTCQIVDLLDLISGSEPTSTTAQLHYAAAVLLETDGNLLAAIERYVAALADPNCRNAALRALLELQPAERASSLLEDVASRVSDPEQRALLLAEAALSASTREEGERLILAAQGSCPDHVVVEALMQHFNDEAAGETLAHEWQLMLSRRARASTSAHERALCCLTLARMKGAKADEGVWLQRAWHEWPKDPYLLDLCEQELDLSLESKAVAREMLAGEMPPSQSRTCVLLEAALYYELAGLSSNAARLAAEVATAEPLAFLCLARTAGGTDFAPKLRQAVSDRALQSDTEQERADWWLLAARLASDTADHAAEREALSQSIQSNPGNLEALLTAEALAFKDGLPRRIADVEKALLKVVSGSTLEAHAQFAARFEQIEHGWSSGYAVLKGCLQGEQIDIVVARKLLPLARRAGDDELYYRLLDRLLAATTRPHDQAILLLRCAEVALRLDKPGTALTHLDDACQLAPKYTGALAERADLLAAQGYHTASADAYERLAHAAASPFLKGFAFTRAAQLLLLKQNPEPADTAGVPSSQRISEASPAADEARVRINLERALDAMPDEPDAFELLVQVYTRHHLESPLEELFERRVQAASEEQRLDLELRAIRAFTELGAVARARELVEAVLARAPDQPQALLQLADLTATDPTAHEQALLRLTKALVADPEKQVSAYSRLGQFYWQRASRPERAIHCFKEVLKRSPSDCEAFDSLVAVLLERGEEAQAKAAVAAFTPHARDETAQRCLQLANAQILGLQSLDDAEAALRQMKGQGPSDEPVMKAWVRLYQRAKAPDRLSQWLEELRMSAARQIPAGPLLRRELTTMAAVMEQLGDASARTLIGAVEHLLWEQPLTMDARGSRAMATDLDQILAPPPLGKSLLNVLSRSHQILERAFPLDLDALHAVELNDPRVLASFDMKARAMGVSPPQLLVVRKQPYACMVTQEPARVILGSAWVELSSPAALDFIAWRALKTLQAHLGPVAHLPAAALMADVEAVLSAYVDTSGSVVASYHAPHLCKRLHPQLKREADLEPEARQAWLALEQSELELAPALALWLNRCALLAVGDPHAAVHAIAMLHGELPPPRSNAMVEVLQKVPEARLLVTSLLSRELAEGHRAIH